MENQPPYQPYQQPYSPNEPLLPLPNATTVLVLGIISIVGCCCLGIVGFICGVIALSLANKDLTLYRANPGAYTEGSYKNVTAGRVCAIIGVVLSSLNIISIIVRLIIYGTVAISHPEQMFHLDRHF